MGDMGVFSFYPTKNMTTGEGGMVVSRDHDTVLSIANIKAFGYDKNLDERRVPGVYDIARLGLNYRMGEMAAAIGIEQLKRLNGFAQARESNMSRLRARLSGRSDLSLLPDGDSRRTQRSDRNP